MARKARPWKGARTPSALKRVRQALRRRTVNRRSRSEAKTLVQGASGIALGRASGDGPAAVRDAISALDRAAAKGVIHPNNAGRRKRRLMAKVNAAHLLDETHAPTDETPKRGTTASKTVQRKKVAAAKASKAASARAADRPRTAAGKAKVAVTRATRETAAARRRIRPSRSESAGGEDQSGEDQSGEDQSGEDQAPDEQRG